MQKSESQEKESITQEEYHRAESDPDILAFDFTPPDYILLCDHFTNSYCQPSQVHYVFEGEEIPNHIPKHNSILVELNEEGDKVQNLLSFSPRFLAYDSNLHIPGNNDNNLDTLPSGLVPEDQSVLVINGAFNPNSPSENVEISDNKIVREQYRVGTITMSEASSKFDHLYSYRNQILQSILDLEATNFEKSNFTSPKQLDSILSPEMNKQELQ